LILNKAKVKEKKDVGKVLLGFFVGEKEL